MINVTRARFRLAVALGGLALTSMLLAACDGDAADEGAPTAEALTTVTLMLNWTPNNHHAGIYVAQANGWYREVGIDLQIVEPAARTERAEPPRQWRKAAHARGDGLPACGAPARAPGGSGSV